MGGGSQSTPAPITPGQAAVAATGSAGAGEQMAVANQPIENYANLATMTQLGPAEQQTQSALQNQAAYQSALAQRDIQSRVDPEAYAQREMRLKAATDRIGQLTSQDPSAFTFRAPQAYTPANMTDVASLSDLRNMGSTIAGNVSTATVNKSGADPRLISPSNPQNPSIPLSYY